MRVSTRTRSSGRGVIDRSAPVLSLGIPNRPPSRLSTRTVLVPVDFSAESEKAIVYATALARQLGGRIILFYVLEPLRTPDFALFPLSLTREQLLQKCKRRLQRITGLLGKEGRFVKSHAASFGRAAEEIVKAARRYRVDLIVISTHGLTGLKRTVLGSTTERVVRQAPCPVLVVRPREREFVSFNIQPSKKELL
jgi:nucleotide-binding universal stress UspA family protein